MNPGTGHRRPLTLLLLLVALAGSRPAPAAPAPAEKLSQSSGGLEGYISMSVPRPPADYRYGVSFYSAVWPLLDAPLSSFQIGLPSTWVVPDNVDFKEPLCPPGTFARDHWPERGPSYRDVFQTIEGGLGFWGSTQFGAAAPKYRINGTPDGYTHEVSSPGWGFGNPVPLDSDQMCIAQLSNRLLIPPDGLTFKKGANGELLGNAWMALPLSEPSGGDTPAPTGDQSWTLFLNSANFKGPVAFWIPRGWSRVSQNYHTAAGRGLDARPGLMDAGAMEVNTVPCFEARDAEGNIYTRIPRLHFPVDEQGNTVLMRDVTTYSRNAIFAPARSWLRQAAGAGAGGPDVTGVFDPAASWVPECSTKPMKLKQGVGHIELAGVDSIVKTTVFRDRGASAFGLEWAEGHRDGAFPEYFKQAGRTRVAIPAAEVPAETRLTARTFESAGAGDEYKSPSRPGDCWTTPGPKLGPFTATLADGSVVTYAWYRFIDQPSLQHLALAESDRKSLQAAAERIQSRWTIERDYMPPPTRGTLVNLDAALVVTPPAGLGAGYVPIVTGQARR